MMFFIMYFVIRHGVDLLMKKTEEDPSLIYLDDVHIIDPIPFKDFYSLSRRHKV